MKYIITEGQNLRLKFLRRRKQILSDIKNTYSYIWPCEYSDVGSFIYAIKVDFLDSLVANWLHSKEEDMFWDLILDEFGNEFRDYYHNMCKKFDYE